MQQPQHELIYSAKDRVPFNLTLVLALGIAAWGAGAVFGLWDMGGNPSLILILGIAVAVYTWLFTPRQYLVYSDALCVAYGQPRVKVIHFSNIAVVEMGSIASLDQLRIRPVRGRRQSIRVRDPETFCDELEAALNNYRAAHPEENMEYRVTGRTPPEDEGAAVADADSAAADLPTREAEVAPSVTDDFSAEPYSPISESESADSPETDEAVDGDDSGGGDAEPENPPPRNLPFY